MDLSTKASISYKKNKLSKKTLLELYFAMLRPRMIEEKMLSLLRQNKISKWFSGIGQEAISVGATLALEPDELIFTMHRNLGVFTARDIPLDRLMLQWQGKEGGFTKGRDRSFHFGATDYGIVGMISHLGPQLSLAAGTALAHRLKSEKKVSLAFTGEGGTSEGEFHEALNTAAVWDLPVIFLIENNGYALSTPTSEQYRCTNLADRGLGYGIESHTIDGNNILEVYHTISTLAASMRKNPRPILLECKTFRMRGHEEASGTKYVPKALMDMWAKKDPINNYEQYLLDERILAPSDIEQQRKSIKKDIEAALKTAEGTPSIVADIDVEISDMFAPWQPSSEEPSSDQKPLRFIDAISDGLKEGMNKHENLVLMGQDIAEYGGVFKITDGFVEAFGNERVRNTPLCESAIVGIGLGLSIGGIKSMVEMQFSDFVSCGFNQIVNNLAKVHYRWEQPADVVIRMPAGGGTGAGPFHSQTMEAWFTHVPGLKVVYPSSPADAKGLLLAALDDPNPYLFFEHKYLYRTLTADVPTGYYQTPVGKAATIRSGNDCTIITYGMGVHWAQAVVEEHGYDAEIIDLRTLVPLDTEAIRHSLAKTNRALILHEATLTSGFGGELSAWISEHCFELLDAPIIRVASMDTPVPFAPALEDQFLPKHRLAAKIHRLLSY